VFSFFLPLYSFWKMDDFSWGSTRLVVGEKGKKIVIHDEGKFDPRSIPLKSWNDYEDELWDHESNHSLGSWMPPQKAEYDSRPPSAYGYEPRSRAMSPAVSYQDLRPQTAYGMPQLSHHGSQVGSINVLPQDNRSAYGDARSMYGGDSRSTYGGSFYGQPPMDLGGWHYPQAGAQHPLIPFDPRASSSSLVNAQLPPQLDHRASAYSLVPQPQPASRPASSFLPEVSIDSGPVRLEEVGITDAQLVISVRRICEGADLDHLTKKGVRKQLEVEFGVGLGGRKETINRIIEEVLAE